MTETRATGDLERIAKQRASQERLLSASQWLLGLIAIGYFLLILLVSDQLFLLLFVLPLVGLIGISLSTQIQLSRISRQELEVLRVVEKND